MGEEEKKEEIVLRVFMHCEGCATKIRRCLKGFHGVENVTADRRTSEVVVKGGKADPLKVLERLQRKSHRKVELISPIPQTQTEPEKEPAEKENEPAQKDKEPDVDKELDQLPAAAVITVVLGVYMHCDACAQEIMRRIQRMEGVESAEADVKSLEVNVKGVFEPQKLIDYVLKRTGKHAVTIRVEAEAEKAQQVEEEKKLDKEEAENKEGAASSSSSGGGGGGEPDAEVDEVNKLLELRKLEFHHHNYPHNHNYYHMYPVQEMNNAYPPHIFSDDNPNACSIM